jgi:lipoprotein NlpI
MILSIALGFVSASGRVSGAEATIDERLEQAHAAHQKGEHARAIKLADDAISAAPTNAHSYYVRGRIYAESRESAKAVADFERVLKIQPRAPGIYQLRGVEHFKLGHFKESIADFDKFIEFVPEQKPHHWRRGISCYYARRYEEGRKQFELHQTVNSNDVENAVWHYVCVARSTNTEKARASLIPIKEDRRIPMMRIYDLFGGKAKPDDVLAAAQANTPSPAQLADQLFYAHLYLGLYFEAAGNQRLAREHILKAADDYPQDHYMGDVARVHAKLLR